MSFLSPLLRMRPLLRVKRSAAYRSSALWRALLRALPASRVAAKPALPLTFVTFGGAGHRLMLAQCLASLALSWPRLPKLRVVSDGSLDAATTARDLAWWPGPWELRSWRELVPGLCDRGHRALVRFAEREPMGRKMAAAAATALEGPTLYCDVDVLWFREPARLAELIGRPAPALVMSEDSVPAYDPALVPGRLPHLAAPPYYCAGLLFAHGDVLAAGGVAELLAEAAERGFGLTEQTIFAEADHRLGGAFLPRDEIALFEEDRFSLGPSFRGRSWAARHYVGQVRHLFWRDALALRLGARP
jgi:hypothetical protein